MTLKLCMTNGEYSVLVWGDPTGPTDTTVGKKKESKRLKDDRTLIERLADVIEFGTDKDLKNIREEMNIHQAVHHHPRHHLQESRDLRRKIRKTNQDLTNQKQRRGSQIDQSQEQSPALRIQEEKKARDRLPSLSNQ